MRTFRYTFRQSLVPTLLLLLLCFSFPAVAQVGPYCASNATDSTGLEILGVTIGSFANYSDCSTLAPGSGSTQNQYSNYINTGTAVQLQEGMTLDVSVLLGTCDLPDSALVKIYIDYNVDGDLTDAGELAFQSIPAYVDSFLTVNGTFTVPSGVTLAFGLTGIRVIAVAINNPLLVTGCGTYLKGETEDYLGNITVSPTCNGVPSAGTITGPPSIQYGVPFTLTANGAATGVDITYQWQYGLSCTGPWTNISGATNSTLTDTIQLGTFVGWYRLVVTCTTSGLTDSSACYAMNVQTCLLDLDVTVTPSGFFGTYDIDLTVSNGAAPFVYDWTNGSTMEDVANVPPGLYCVTVQDSNACSADTCILIGSSNVIATGTLFNTAGLPIPVTLTTDSFLTFSVVYTDTNGYFIDTLVFNTAQAMVIMTFEDCSTALQTNIGFSSPANMTVDFQDDYCPTATSVDTVYIFGNVEGSSGNYVQVYTGGALAETFTTDSNGDFSGMISLSLPSVVTIGFVNCDSTWQLQNFTVTLPNDTINYAAIFCDSTINFVTVYGQLLNPDTAGVWVIIVDTDSDTAFVVTTPTGAFNVELQILDTLGEVEFAFNDCNGEPFYNSYPILNNEVYITEDYCPTNPIDTCAALYDASYDATNNAFLLEMDSATQSIAYDYFWDFGDGTSSTDQFPTHVYTVSDLYNVCLFLSDSNGAFCFYCHTIGIDSLGNVVTRQDGDGFTINVVPFGYTAQSGELPEQSFDLYPNPVDDESTVKLYSDEARVYIISVYNAVGQRVYALTADVNKGTNYVQVPMKNLVPGMYLMSVDFGNKTVSRSFAK